MNNNKELLENIILSEDIESSVRNNEELLLSLIPELMYEKGFDQKNKYHIYDVWNHTICALKNSDNDLIIRLSLLLHDIGKPFSFQEEENIRHFKGHAQKSSEIAKEVLIRLGYDAWIIEMVLFLINNHSTKIDINNIDINQINKYSKLIHIQICDATAYNPDYSLPVIDKLLITKSRIDIINKHRKK